MDNRNLTLKNPRKKVQIMRMIYDRNIRVKIKIFDRMNASSFDKTNLMIKKIVEKLPEKSRVTFEYGNSTGSCTLKFEAVHPLFGCDITCSGQSIENVTEKLCAGLMKQIEDSTVSPDCLEGLSQYRGGYPTEFVDRLYPSKSA